MTGLALGSDAQSWRLLGLTVIARTLPDGPMRVVAYGYVAVSAVLFAAWFLIGFVRWLSGRFGLDEDVPRVRRGSPPRVSTRTRKPRRGTPKR